MADSLNLIIQVIRVDIFIAFGLYSMLYVLITVFTNDIKLLETIDINTIRFIRFAGIMYISLILIWTIIVNHQAKHEQRFWWTPWLQLLLWTFITQLFWIKRIRTLKIMRIFLALLLIISFETYVIIVTSLHRDYMPQVTSIFQSISPFEILVSLSTKIILFCLLAMLYAFLISKLKLIRR